MSKTGISSAGYKVFSNPNVKLSEALYIYCQIENNFSERIEEEQRMDVLDRLLRSFSNMALNESPFRSPNQYFDMITELPNADLLALSEHLYGRTAASLMNS